MVPVDVIIAPWTLLNALFHAIYLNTAGLKSHEYTTILLAMWLMSHVSAISRTVHLFCVRLFGMCHTGKVDVYPHVAGNLILLRLDYRLTDPAC